MAKAKETTNAPVEEYDERTDKAKVKVANAISILSNPIGCLTEGRIINAAAHEIAKAVNILESAGEELRWACKKAAWDVAVCDQINEACSNFGQVLAGIVGDKKEDETLLGVYGTSGMACLGKVLASLVCWYDN